MRAAGPYIMSFRFSFAMRAEKTHKSLSDTGNESLGKQIWMHPHIRQTSDAAPGTVGMQGRQLQMTGQGTPDGHLRRVLIADLTEHYYVRVLA